MSVPALIIGLGGTGVWAATYIKKELLELEGNPFNQVAILAFDTIPQSEATVGGRGRIRGRQESTGGVRLETGEYFFIGGNVQHLMREVAGGQHPHLNSWLLADFYLQNLADRTFNLNEGAGQFRQFGRLAVFKDVAASSTSTIYGTIQAALVKIKRNNPTLKSLQVFIVGSLAGGTGAGMFIDAAHLVREIATQDNVDLKGKMSIRGYLVLPDAFSRTVDQALLRSMYARAYAGMRESRRFTVSFDHEQGYPMHYRAGSGHPLWHGAIIGKLFDLLYFLDGQGERGAVTSASLANGVAPAIADAISAAIDGEAGPHFAAYAVNIEAERTQRIARGDLSSKTATYGSVGTFSIVFPVYHVVETWAHDLGLALLNQLLAPTEFDERSGLPTALSVNANEEYRGEEGRMAGFDFLRANRPVTYQYRDQNGNLQSEQIEPTLLPGELARIAAEARQPNSGIMQMLMSRRMADWEPSFYPHADDSDTRRLIQRVESVLNTHLYTSSPGQIQPQVLASDQQAQQEDPLQGAERILQEVRVFKNRYLGTEDPRTGRRAGGAYHNSLLEIANYQVRRFGLLLDRQMSLILNGQPNNLPQVARGGKLGFLKDFLGGLAEALELARNTLQRVQQQRQEKGDSRRNALAETQAAAKTMRDSADDKNILRRPARAAFQTQHRYLEAESRLVELLQVEATEEAILYTVNQIMDYVLSARSSLQEWEQALARQQGGLYDRLLRGRQEIDGDRRAASDVAVRHIIRDAAYEQRRYEAYLGRVDEGWLNGLLGGVRWTLEHQVVSGRPKAHFGLTLTGGSEQAQSLELERHEDNLRRLLALCRRPFAPAWKEESVVGYLLDHPELRDPIKLGEQIYAHGGTLLGFEGGEPLPANFLRAYFQAENEEDTAYLRQVIQYLAERSGQSITETVHDDESGQEQVQENRFARFLNSEDRFKLTLVFNQELIELDRINSYRRSGLGAYLGTQDRRLLHIFPAEVNAARYESRLIELKQEVRLFSDDVTLQLERIERFHLFLLCYVYNLIRRDSEQDAGGSQQTLWKLYLPPSAEFTTDGRGAITEEIWLTDPKRPPHILDALMTFNYEGRDARAKFSNYVLPIDYVQVQRVLAHRRHEDAQQRVQEGTAGQGNPDLLGQVQALNDDAQQKLLVELARIDRIRQQQFQIEQKTLPGLSHLLGHPHNQKDYDIASIFALMLRDEAASARRAVQDAIKALRGVGDTKIPADFIPSQPNERLDPW